LGFSFRKRKTTLVKKTTIAARRAFAIHNNSYKDKFARIKMEEPIIRGIYEHFKGGRYRVLDIVLNCEDPTKKIVIYEQLYAKENRPIGTKWARNLEDFVESVDKKLPNGAEYIGPRFTLVN
jgi:hypothetical protein